ncbi:MAG TPA: Xaa-Pro peptidase family protein [Methylomirabilota bacterium]|nr:Xaa-Pro peptidase family protein [Methylomirabilota bacterium]
MTKPEYDSSTPVAARTTIEARREPLRQAFVDAGLVAVLTDAPPDILYYTGCPDIVGYLLLTAAGQSWLLTSAHDAPQAASVCVETDVAVWRPGENPIAILSERLTGLATGGLGVVSLPASVFVSLGAAGISACPTPGLTAALRRFKEPGELDLIRHAARIVEAGMGAARSVLRPGIRESQVEDAASAAMRDLGQDGWLFKAKIESGWRSAWPSVYASDKEIAAGDLVLIDLGPTYRGYYGDLTRTFVLGEPSPDQRRLLETVLHAQAAAIAAVRPGATGRQVDAAARDVLTAAGYGDRFLHHTGHTLGLAGDGSPSVAPDGDLPLLAGECITIEPGAYLPDLGGCRIEDEILVTPDGPELLTNFPRRLDDLILT